MRKFASITTGLIFMIGFFVGLTLAIRASSPLNVIAGVALMVLTPAVHQWLTPAVLRGEPLKAPRFLASLRGIFPLLGPIILFFLLMTIARIAGREFGYWGLLLFLVFMAPMVSILIDAMQGKRHWEVTELSSAWANLTLFTLGMLICVLVIVGVLFLVYPMGLLTLLLSVGDFLYQWFADISPVQPYLCKQLISLPLPLPCGLLLVIWHIVTVFLMWWLADKHDLILDKVAGLLKAVR